MPIDPIAHLQRTARLIGPGEPDKAANSNTAADNFSQVLGQALDNLNQAELAADQAVAKLAAGEDIELHQVMLAMQEADIAFQLALQVRNKLVEAYQEIMRLQV